MIGSQRQARSKRIAYRANSATRRRPQQRAQNLGKQMRVLVCVEVRYGDARGLNLANLRGGFGSNLVGVHAAGNRACCEFHHTVAEMRRGRERWELSRGKNRLAVGKHDMATNAQLRDSLREFRGLGKSRAVGHER